MTGTKYRSIRTRRALGIHSITLSTQTRAHLSLVCQILKVKVLAISTDVGTGACTHACKHWVTNETNNRKRPGKCNAGGASYLAPMLALIRTDAHARDTRTHTHKYWVTNKTIN